MIITDVEKYSVQMTNNESMNAINDHFTPRKEKEKNNTAATNMAIIIY